MSKLEIIKAKYMKRLLAAKESMQGCGDIPAREAKFYASLHETARPDESQSILEQDIEYGQDVGLSLEFKESVSAYGSYYDILSDIDKIDSIELDPIESFNN